MRQHSFAPVVNEATKVLIIGSMPSVQSLSKQQYYGNPRNHFWPIMEALTAETAPVDYAERVAWLLKHKIGLWDAVASCEREGSLDANIQQEEPNDFAKLFAQYPQITHIVFNGTKAESVFRRKVGLTLLDDRKYERLPSTSPIPGRYIKTLPQKIEAWQIVKEWLNE